MKNIIIVLVLISTFNAEIKSQNKEENKSKIIFSYGLNNVSYCRFDNFLITKDSIVKNPNLKILKNENTSFLSNLKNKLIVNSMLSFNWNNEHVFYINFYKIYKDKKENITYSSKTIRSIKNINYIMKLKNEAFWLFYKKKNNPKYPEINKLKPLVQDFQGILDIEKLGEVIKNNQSTLKKYLDN